MNWWWTEYEMEHDGYRFGGETEEFQMKYKNGMEKWEMKKRAKVWRINIQEWIKFKLNRNSIDMQLSAFNLY